MEQEKMTELQNKLLEWYDKSARSLPWRDNPSPYRVWISEIMLQQTRVHTVKPYFEKFMQEIPTIQALANTSEDKLLKLWEGLGYYNRAINLKKAARIIVQDFGGEMPSELEKLRSLPGIGPYSSGAIASIAFGIRAAAIDGNVLRVMARLTANKEDIKNTKIKKEIEEMVNKVLPENRIGDFNQALMELGATICLPNGLPKCADCPLQFTCEGYHQGVATSIPLKTKKKTRKTEKKTIFVIKWKDKIAIRQRPKEGLLSNLWEFPHVEGHSSYEDGIDTVKQWGITAYELTPLEPSKHIFTHLEWHMVAFLAITEKVSENHSFLWVTQRELESQYSIPSAFKAYLNYILKQEK